MVKSALLSVKNSNISVLQFKENYAKLRILFKMAYLYFPKELAHIILKWTCEPKEKKKGFWAISFLGINEEYQLKQANKQMLLNLCRRGFQIFCRSLQFCWEADLVVFFEFHFGWLFLTLLKAEMTQNWQMCCIPNFNHLHWTETH